MPPITQNWILDGSLEWMHFSKYFWLNLRWIYRNLSTDPNGNTLCLLGCMAETRAQWGIYLFETFAKEETWSFLTPYPTCAVHGNPWWHFLSLNLCLFLRASIWITCLHLRMLAIWFSKLELILHPRWEFPECCGIWINCPFEPPNSSFIVIAHINHHLNM